MKKPAPCLFAVIALAFMLPCETQSAFAHETSAKQIASANVVASSDAPGKSARGPYYIDFRARTAASWGHAFVWYGKTGERMVDVAGLTPAGDTTQYMLGYVMGVPSETGASYGDLDAQYLTASYKVYLNEADARKVFVYIKKLQANSPVWSAEVFNCTNFIGEIASFMGLKTPSRLEPPEQYVNDLKEMNGRVEMVRLSPEQ